MIIPNRLWYPNSTNDMLCPTCDDRIHKTIMPTADGYDFLTWTQNEGVFILISEAQQHVPVGHISHMESSVHL